MKSMYHIYHDIKKEGDGIKPKRDFEVSKIAEVKQKVEKKRQQSQNESTTRHAKKAVARRPHMETAGRRPHTARAPLASRY